MKKPLSVLIFLIFLISLSLAYIIFVEPAMQTKHEKQTVNANITWKDANDEIDKNNLDLLEDE